MLNRIIIQGRLCADPEIRQTPGGVKVASLRLAVERDYKPEGGERETDFISVTAWKGAAEFCERYFQKGRMAIVSGRLQMRSWTDKDGGKRTSYEVNAENLYFGDSKPSEAGDSKPSEAAETAPQKDTFQMLDDSEDPLPF